MCGIVGYISRRQGGLYKKDLDLIEAMLVFNTVRGKDSTGVFSRKRNGDIFGTKTATHPLNLFACDAWGDFTQEAVSSGSFVIGHGRAATIGEVKNDNAHPFIENNIILVHNGTLRTTKNISDVSTEVDSHAIAHALVAKSPEEVLKELNGAFALVWYNTEEAKLYAVRNDERPLMVLEDENDGYIICSEDWIGGIPAMRQKRKITKRTLIEPGELYTWDSSKRNELTTRQVLLREPDNWQNYGQYSHSYRGGSATKAAVDAQAKETNENFQRGRDETPEEITRLRERLAEQATTKALKEMGASKSCALTQSGDTVTGHTPTTTPTSQVTHTHSDEETAQARTVSIQVTRDDFKPGTVCLFKIHSINPKPTASGRMKYMGKIREPGKEMVDCIGFLPRTTSLLDLDPIMRNLQCGLVHHVTHTTNGGTTVMMQSNIFETTMQRMHENTIPQSVWWRAMTHGKCDTCGRQVNEWEAPFTSVRMTGDVVSKTEHPMNVIEMTCPDCVAERMTAGSEFRKQYEAKYNEAEVAEKYRVATTSSGADAVSDREQERSEPSAKPNNVIALPGTKTVH